MAAASGICNDVKGLVHNGKTFESQTEGQSRSINGFSAKPDLTNGISCAYLIFIIALDGNAVSKSYWFLQKHARL